LSEKERIRSHQFHFESDRHAFIVRHGILRAILGRLHGIDPQQVKICTGSYGKPYIERTGDVDPIQFNMSRSKDMVLFGFCRGRQIGVDIEFEASEPDFEQIVTHFFSASEQASFHDLPESQKKPAFYHCWTQKEAFLKALGDGISRGLDQFDVSTNPTEPAKLIRVLWHPDSVFRWSLKTVKSIPGYCAAVAVEGRFEKLRIQEIAPTKTMALIRLSR